MADSNREALAQAYDAWGRGDLEAALACIHPDIQWINSGAIPDVATIYRGPDGVREFWHTWRDVWEEISIEVDRMVELGDEIMVVGRFKGRGRGGIEVDRAAANLYTFRDGLIVRQESFMLDPEHAVAEFEAKAATARV